MVAAVSVVVPTTGRVELDRAVSSAQGQTVPPFEIVVVDDSAEGAVTVDRAGPAQVVLVRTSGREGAAAARNAGLAAARGELVAFLDDDDSWLPGHLAAATALLTARPDIDVYACAALVRYPDGERVEPTVVYRGRGSLLRFYFGRTTWARRRRRVLTPTLVFRRRVAAHRMDPRLSAMEDLWWLFQVELAGHRILQSAEVGVVVHADGAREAARLPLQVAFEWADRLDALHPGTGTAYLVGTVARSSAREGRTEEVAQIDEVVRGRGQLPVDLRAVLALERHLARTRRHETAGA